jgi:DNA-binding LytR/AlgR family response regulator
MRVLIVDDESAARRRLALMLEDLDVEVVGEAANGIVALELVASLQPDLILLDISMPEVDGFDVARHLPEPRPLIVFQTAYDEHALAAFDHAALDYLVKPVTRDRLERTLQRAEERLPVDRSTSAAPLEAGVLEAFREMVGASSRRARLLVRARHGHRLVPFNEILRFSAVAGVAYAHLTDDRHLTDYTLKELEERTAGSFIRTSRSELVNLDHLLQVTTTADGSCTLGLSNGSTVVVSRRRTAAVRAAVEELARAH